MKPIETSYKGYRFRSRLEARWAVFFDHLRVPWTYELQGFELPSGRYLPDFQIALDQFRLPVWLEVKPTRPRLHELAVAMELSDATGCTVLMAAGSIPWDDHGPGLLAFTPPDDVRRGYWRCSAERGLFIESGAFAPRLDPAVRTAFRTARSARFEFGESGEAAVA